MIRVLSVRQPWAWAIVHGGKTVENRIRNVAGDYRGPVAIQASKEWAELLTVEDWRLLVPAWAEHGADKSVRFPAETYTEVMPLGAIIGVVALVDVHDWLNCSPWCSRWAEFERLHLVFVNPRPLHTPIPFKGALHLQTAPEGVEADIVRQIGPVAG